jgi:hypothetical protein
MAINFKTVYLCLDLIIFWINENSIKFAIKSLFQIVRVRPKSHLAKCGLTIKSLSPNANDPATFCWYFIL